MTYIYTRLLNSDCAIAKKFSRQLLTAAVRIRSQVRYCGIYDEQYCNVVSCLRILLFPLPIIIQAIALHSSIILRCDPLTKWTRSHPTPAHEFKDMNILIFKVYYSLTVLLSEDISYEQRNNNSRIVSTIVILLVYL
jgi:hypothetical protein